MLKRLLLQDIKEIGEGLRDLPANILLLILAILKATLSDTQTQLIVAIAILLGILVSWPIASLSFLGIYTLCYFISNTVKGVLNYIAPLLSSWHRPNNE